jgi:hypothetical protein
VIERRPRLRDSLMRAVAAYRGPTACGSAASVAERSESAEAAGSARDC